VAPATQKNGGDKMEKEKAQNKEPKKHTESVVTESHSTEPKNLQERSAKKKKGKIAKVFSLYEKGMSAKQISEKMNLSVRLVRSYIWRAKNPEAYKELLARYFQKKQKKKEAAKPSGT
jgi:DNA-binding NarL/FixJ family response regulator